MSKAFPFIDYGEDYHGGSLLVDANSLRFYRQTAFDVLDDAFNTQAEDLKKYPYGSRKDLSAKEENDRLKLFISTYNALDKCVSAIMAGQLERFKAESLREYTMVFDDQTDVH